jgi:hypothetical protein
MEKLLSLAVFSIPLPTRSPHHTVPLNMTNSRLN